MSKTITLHHNDERNTPITIIVDKIVHYTQVTTYSGNIITDVLLVENKHITVIETPEEVTHLLSNLG